MATGLFSLDRSETFCLKRGKSPFAMTYPVDNSTCSTENLQKLTMLYGIFIDKYTFDYFGFISNVTITENAGQYM